VSVVWHDLECGTYREDLSLWRALADEHPGPILDVGAGTGRVALELARSGHEVTALDRDPELLAELERRATALDVTTVVADARDFELGRTFGLCIVPMQTIQLLGGPDGRAGFLACARRHLAASGAVAIAVAASLDLYETSAGSPAPLPDICELDGIVYSSQPTAVRADGDGFVLERRRETVTLDGRRSVSDDAIRLDRLTARELEQEAVATGLRMLSRARIPATSDYVGSTVVIAGA
jgi:SAM-dependent methyltransferase